MPISQRDQEIWDALDYLYDFPLTVEQRVALVLTKSDEKLKPLWDLPTWALHRWSDPNYG